MKYLSDYTNDKTSEVFNKYGAFFAFSQKQLNEGKKEGVEYTSLGGGLIAPVENAEKIMPEIKAIGEAARKQDIAENGIKAIIHRELANYECQITSDYSDALDALKPYGITEDQVSAEWGVFFQKCIDNDWF